MTKHLHIGGLVAAGFDSSGGYLLTISHAGRGLFSTETWERVARDSTLAYPEKGFAVGIGPIAGLSIPVVEIDCNTGCLSYSCLDGTLHFGYESGCLRVSDHRV